MSRIYKNPPLVPGSIRRLDQGGVRMRHVVVTALAGLSLAAATGAAGGSQRSRLAELAWMAGSWANEQDGKRSEEHWTAPAGGMMLGVHRDVEGASGSFEFLRIEESAGKVTYLASPQGRPATPFELVESSAQRAVFANPKHDFPQRILYWRDGASLCAAVEGPMEGETIHQEWCWTPASLGAAK
jgi:hypothetical protein